MRWIEVDDGVVIYNAATGGFADLNASAAELWLVLSEADWSEAAAVEHLTNVHGLPVGEARSIVAAFTADLTRTAVLEDDQP